MLRYGIPLISSSLPNAIVDLREPSLRGLNVSSSTSPIALRKSIRTSKLKKQTILQLVSI